MYDRVFQRWKVFRDLQELDFTDLELAKVLRDRQGLFNLTLETRL